MILKIVMKMKAVISSDVSSLVINSNIKNKTRVSI